MCWEQPSEQPSVCFMNLIQFYCVLRAKTSQHFQICPVFNHFVQQCMFIAISASLDFRWQIYWHCYYILYTFRTFKRLYNKWNEKQAFHKNLLHCKSIYIYIFKSLSWYKPDSSHKNVAIQINVLKSSCRSSADIL